MKDSMIIKEVVLNAPVSKVWMALTNKNEMKQWYFDLEEFKPEPGYNFQFWGGTETRIYLHLCQVKSSIPNQSLSYSWKYENIPGETLLTFDLFEEEDKTRLRLTHNGLDSFPSDNPDLSSENFDAGWEYIINMSLKNYLEKQSNADNI
jgi:uncharacterized protein YndB with AHSA1/START domain